MRRQHAWDVVGQAAACDVGKAVHRHGFGQRQHGGHVDARRCEQAIKQRASFELGFSRCVAERQQATDQGVAIRMRTGGGETDHSIADANSTAIDDGVFLHNADTEARQVVVTAVVHARHLGRFAAHQRTTGESTTLDDARDHAFGYIDVEFARRIVVEEKQRLCALDGYVVDAHADEVDADGVMPTRVDRQSQFRTHAIGARNEYWALPATFRQLHQRAESADAGQNLRASRALDERLDPLDQLIAGVNVHTGVAIGQPLGFRWCVCHGREGWGNSGAVL